MALINWDESLSVHVSKIDEQHKKLISILNDLGDAISESSGKDTIQDLLKRLADYTVYHFDTEEKYFEKFDYELTDQHKKLHKGFVNKIKGFQSAFDKGKSSISIEAMQFLTDWIMDHIGVVDQKYTGCFHAHKLY